MFSGLTVFVLAGTLFAAVRGLVVPDTSVHQLTKRVVYQCQDPAQLDIATNAYNEGKVMAAAARDYINSHGVSDPLVVQYFGNDTSLIPRVSLIYNQIANEAGANYTINCAPSGGCGDRTVARNIRFTNFCTQGGVTRECGWSSRTDLCPPFWNRPVMSCSVNINSAAGSREDTIVHEMSHAFGRTSDYVSGCSFSRNLALNNATQATDNAYNFGCFSMEVYKATRC